MKTIKGLKGWITKAVHKDDTIPYCYANVGKLLTQEDLDDLFTYCGKMGFEFAIVISGINPLRPQRTWGSLPEWFRNNTQRYELYHSDNTFCFIRLSQTCFGEEKDGKDALFEDAKRIEMKVSTCKVFVWMKEELK